ncbi:MAG: YdcF family protein [Eubacteriales bacterium]|nr:YdcF family protein [Eubacteriales bacterium]
MTKVKKQAKKGYSWVEKGCFSLIFFSLLIIVSILLPSGLVILESHGQIKPSEVYLKNPSEKFAAIVVFGAGLNKDGSPSLVLEDRLKEAAKLYHGKLAEKIIVTGDHTPPYYDEVSAMQHYLEEAAVPSSAIIKDGQGFSTFASVENLFRASKKEDSSLGAKAQGYLFVTQRYHLYRAVYIANKMGLEVQGAPSERRFYPGSFYYYLREILARDKDALQLEFYLRDIRVNLRDLIE